MTTYTPHEFVYYQPAPKDTTWTHSTKNVTSALKTSYGEVKNTIHKHTIMKLLETNIRRKGYDYTQIERRGDVAIYRQDLNGDCIAYEVFEIRKHNERIIAGVLIPASEGMASDEQWGQNAFTVHTLEQAHGKMLFISENIIQRNVKSEITNER